MCDSWSYVLGGEIIILPVLSGNKLGDLHNADL